MLNEQWLTNYYLSIKRQNSKQTLYIFLIKAQRDRQQDSYSCMPSTVNIAMIHPSLTHSAVPPSQWRLPTCLAVGSITRPTISGPLSPIRIGHRRSFISLPRPSIHQSFCVQPRASHLAVNRVPPFSASTDPLQLFPQAGKRPVRI